MLRFHAFLRRLEPWIPWALILLFVAVVTAGTVAAWGTCESQSSAAQPLPRALNAVYRALQLFALNGDWTVALTAHESVPLAQFARIGAPLLIFLAAVRIFFSQLRRFFAATFRPRADHIVLCGFGDAAQEFFRAWQKHEGAKPRMVVIASQAEMPALIGQPAPGAYIVAGAPGDSETLSHVRANRARRIVLLLPSGEENVTAAVAIAEFLSKHRHRTVQVWSHVRDAAFAEQLEFVSHFHQTRGVEHQFFNVYDLAARDLLLYYPPDRYADLADAGRPHLVIYGFDDMGQAIAAKAACLCHYRNDARLKITAFDRNAAVLEAAFLDRYPAISKVCDIAVKAVEFHDASFPRHGVDMLPIDATQHIVTFGNQEEAATFALSLRAALLSRADRNRAILVRIRHNDELGRLFSDGDHRRASVQPHGFHVFGALERILNLETDYVERDRLAELIHERSYLVTRDTRPRSDFWGKRNNVPWPSLPQYMRESNREAVDLIDAKLAAIRHRRVYLDPGRKLGPTVGFSPADIEVIAKIEKQRWNAERFMAGWTCGPRAELAKQHNTLMPWNELASMPEGEGMLRYDRTQAEDLPEIVNGRIICRPPRPGGHKLIHESRSARKALQEVRPAHVIGITGQREIGSDRSDLATIEKKLSEALKQLAVEFSPRPAFVVVSALADGIDRVAARVAKQVLEAALIVPCPLPFELYAQDFGGKDPAKRTKSVNAFRDQLSEAERFYELPMRFGSLGELEATPARRRDQYALLGGYLVSHCDTLLAVWNGQAPATESERAERFGGTWLTVAWWKDPESIPEEFRWHPSFHAGPTSRRLIEIFID